MDKFENLMTIRDMKTRRYRLGLKVQMFLKEDLPSRKISLGMDYWYENIDNMNIMFDDHFPEAGLPEWINYNLFKEDILFKMSQTFLFDIMDILKGYEAVSDDEVIEVDFKYELGLPLYSSYLDTGTSVFFDALDSAGDAFIMKINHPTHGG